MFARDRQTDNGTEVIQEMLLQKANWRHSIAVLGVLSEIRIFRHRLFNPRCKRAPASNCKVLEPEKLRWRPERNAFVCSRVGLFCSLLSRMVSSPRRVHNQTNSRCRAMWTSFLCLCWLGTAKG